MSVDTQEAGERSLMLSVFFLTREYGTIILSWVILSSTIPFYFDYSLELYTKVFFISFFNKERKFVEL
jgi:hypothetical protein